MNGGIEVSQEGFVRDFLRSHQHAGGRAKTQGPKETLIMSVEEEAGMLEAVPVDLKGKEHLVKEAHRRVGEMLWFLSPLKAGYPVRDFDYVVENYQVPGGSDYHRRSSTRLPE